MKRKRHIEITAVRRRITVVTSDAPAAASCKQPTQNNKDEFWSTVADLTKQANSFDTQLESARSPEVRGLIEELAESSNDTDIAAKQRESGPDESCRKLRRVWGLSFKQLKNRIDDRIDNHRGK